MSYIENPKTKGSGIVCAIPQKGSCPIKCADCFFQSGRSYLEPLEENLPNIPSIEESIGRVIRINDGNDSNVDRETVIEASKFFTDVFYNTSIPKDLEGFIDPVVLTVNPGNMTDHRAHMLDPIPNNLMFVRFRANSWNVDLLKEVVSHYTSRNVPVVLTFMAFYTETLKECQENYELRKRTSNEYLVIKQEAWDEIMDMYKDNNLVYSCGKDAKTHACSRCGNCLREYFNTKERILVKNKITQKEDIDLSGYKKVDMLVIRNKETGQLELTDSGEKFREKFKNISTK